MGKRVFLVTNSFDNSAYLPTLWMLTLIFVSSNGIYEFGQYASLNLCKANKNSALYGLEFIYGQKRITSKSAVDIDEWSDNKRIQFTMKYNFENEKKI